MAETSKHYLEQVKKQTKLCALEGLASLARTEAERQSVFVAIQRELGVEENDDDQAVDC